MVRETVARDVKARADPDSSALEASAILELWQQDRSEHAATLNRLEDVRRLLLGTPGSLLVVNADGAILGVLIAAWDGWWGNMYRLPFAVSFAAAWASASPAGRTVKSTTTGERGIRLRPSRGLAFSGLLAGEYLHLPTLPSPFGHGLSRGAHTAVTSARAKPSWPLAPTV